jgi:hypothetical protein
MLLSEKDQLQSQLFIKQYSLSLWFSPGGSRPAGGFQEVFVTKKWEKKIFYQQSTTASVNVRA